MSLSPFVLTHPLILTCSCPIWIGILTERKLAGLYRRTSGVFLHPGQNARSSPIISEIPSSDDDSSSDGEGGDSSTSKGDTDSDDGGTPISLTQALVSSAAIRASHFAPSIDLSHARTVSPNAIDIDNEISIHLHVMRQSRESELKVFSVYANGDGSVCLWTSRHEMKAHGGILVGMPLEIRRNGAWKKVSWYVGYGVRNRGSLVLRTPGADTGDWQIDTE